MTLTVVIDGGGTGCRIAALNESGETVALVKSFPANLSLGAENVWDAIKSGLVLLAAELDKPEGWMPDNIWCGLAGSQQLEQLKLFKQLLPENITCHVINDGHAQLLGCSPGSVPLACLSIGTGSVLNYIDQNGQHHMQGGWGFPVGDQGSGAWLGLLAVNQLTQWYDTQGDIKNAPPLIRKLLEVIEPNVQSILKYSTCKNPKILAQLAPIVFETAPRDKTAREIISEGTRHFQNLIAETSSDTRIYIAGGLAKSYQPYLEALLKQDVELAPTDAAITGLFQYANKPGRQ